MSGEKRLFSEATYASLGVRACCRYHQQGGEALAPCGPVDAAKESSQAGGLCEACMPGSKSDDTHTCDWVVPPAPPLTIAVFEGAHGLPKGIGRLVSTQQRVADLLSALVILHANADRGELDALLCEVLGPGEAVKASDLRGLAARESAAVTEEPAPIRNTAPHVWDLVIDDLKQRACVLSADTDGLYWRVAYDMRDRDLMGAKRYGVHLQAHNGRNPLIDAYQEALDCVVYLRQAIEEGRPVQDSYRLSINMVLGLKAALEAT
jgi:hypothetical protein